MKGANRYMKILLLFEEKFHLGKFDLFSLEAIFYSLIGIEEKFHLGKFDLFSLEAIFYSLIGNV